MTSEAHTAHCEGWDRCSCSHLCSAPHWEPVHTTCTQPQPVTRLSPLPSPAELFSSRGEVTHLSLARARGLSWVCGSAGPGAAAWCTKPLLLGTAPLAAPLPGVSKTVPPSGGVLCRQRASLGPAHRQSAAHKIPGQRETQRVPNPLSWIPLVILTKRGRPHCV